MICPCCDSELELHDYFGRIASHQDGRVLGDIWKCTNEECDSVTFNYYFYTYRDNGGNLHEGYPC